jgi:hypothetical protein
MNTLRNIRSFRFQYVRTALPNARTALPNAAARKDGHQRCLDEIVYWIAATAWTALAPAAAHLPFAASV